MEEKGLKRAGVAQLAYLGEEFTQENMEVEAQIQVVGEASGVHNLPACKYVSTIHKENHETLQNAYDAICLWITEHPSYHLAGPVIERFIKDGHDGDDVKHCETGILFPVIEIK